MLHKKISHTVILLTTFTLIGCAGSPLRMLITPQASAPDGYELAAEADTGQKWYIAPQSKSDINIESMNPLTGKVEVNTFTSVSVFVAWPHPYAHVKEYSVQAFACRLLPGTFIIQSSDKRGWDDRYTTEAYGTPRWKVWQKVCKNM